MWHAATAFRCQNAPLWDVSAVSECPAPCDRYTPAGIRLAVVDGWTYHSRAPARGLNRTHEGIITVGYAISTTLDRSIDEALAAVRAALAEQGFGVLTEIDLAATLKKKLDVDIAPQVILGACNPPFAHRALQAEPSIGLLLPCNVVVRSAGEGRTIVEAIDPGIMVAVTDNPALADVTAEVAARLRTVISSLGRTARAA